MRVREGERGEAGVGVYNHTGVNDSVSGVVKGVVNGGINSCSDVVVVAGCVVFADYTAVGENTSAGGNVNGHVDLRGVLVIGYY